MEASLAAGCQVINSFQGFNEEVIFHITFPETGARRLLHDGARSWGTVSEHMAVHERPLSYLAGRDTE